MAKEGLYVSIFNHASTGDKPTEVIDSKSNTEFDWSYVDQIDKLKANIAEKYKKLIDSQTKLNKDIKILMIYGSLNEEHAYYLIDKTYQCLEPFYPNLFIHKLHGDNTGISNHAYVTAHEKMAEELKAVIKELLD